MPTPIPITDSALLRLMAWLSPSFPVGAYAYSHGAEAAVETGRVLNRARAIEWIGFVLLHGTGRMDADLFVQAYAATRDDNTQAVLDVVAHADALKGTKELGLESRAQGQAFFDAVLAAWPDDKLKALSQVIKAKGLQPSYATAVAMASALAGVGLQAALGAYLHAFAANIASAIVRLVPLGQTDGQKIIAALEPMVEQALAESLTRDAGDIGSAAFMVDWLSMTHETQYSRLFRS